MKFLQPLSLGIALLPAIVDAYKIQCFSNQGCTGDAGLIKYVVDYQCVNVIGRQSCRLWDHQGPGGGPGFIQYQRCNYCNAVGDYNCEAYTCRAWTIGLDGTCIRIYEGPSSLFRTVSTAGCLIGRAEAELPGNQSVSREAPKMRGTNDLIK